MNRGLTVGFFLLLLLVFGVLYFIRTPIPQHTTQVVYRTITLPAETSEVYVPVDRILQGRDRFETSYVSMRGETLYVGVQPQPTDGCDSAKLNNISWEDSIGKFRADVLVCGRLLDIELNYTIRERNIQLAETLYIPRNKHKWIPYITAGSSPLLGVGVMRDRWMLGYVYTPNNQWQHGVQVSFLLRKP